MTPQYLLRPARLAGSPLLATQSDERLVDLVRAGSEPAFDAIVARYRGQLLRYCSAIVGGAGAEDVVQQTFVNAFNSMTRDEKGLNLKPWLYRIAHNVSLNALRDRAAVEDELEAELAGAEPPDRELERQEQLGAVLAAVQELPPRQRDAIVLRELEGRSYEEIAAALGVGGGAVRGLLNRARNSVRVAATAITPVGLLLRIPPHAGEAGGDTAVRVAELTAGAGAGAVMTKVAATALVTGAVAGGVALGPGSGDGEPRAREDRPAAGEADARGAAAGEADGRGAAPAVAGENVEHFGGDGDADDRDSSGPGSGERPGEDRSGPGDGDADGDVDNSGPGNAEDPRTDNSGPGSDNSGSGSDSSGSGSGDSDSGGSGSSGSGDGDGSSGSGSGSSGSGSGDSGSGDLSGSSGSGSGTSGSGSGSSGFDDDSSGSGSG